MVFFASEALWTEVSLQDAVERHVPDVDTGFVPQGVVSGGEPWEVVRVRKVTGGPHVGSVSWHDVTSQRVLSPCTRPGRGSPTSSPRPLTLGSDLGTLARELSWEPTR